MTEARLICGDALEVLRGMPAGSVHCCATSPPYYSLRDYGCAGQIGLEPTPAAYVSRLVEVFREVRRVLRDDGTLWCNLGDSYGSGEVGRHDQKAGAYLTGHGRAVKGAGEPRQNHPIPGHRQKQLLGIPWRVAFALQDDGWLLRSEIIWHKPNPMPESVRDRPTKSHEQIFLLAKQGRYHYDAGAVREPATPALRITGPGNGSARQALAAGKKPSGNGVPGRVMKTGDRRNRRSVWTVATKPYRAAHFACFPPKLIEPCILAGTSERGCCPACGAPWVRVVERGDIRPLRGNSTAGPKASTGEPFGRMVTGLAASGWTPGVREQKTIGWQPSCSCPPADAVPCTVLDPFAGAATTGLVALEHGRNFVGIELNASYIELARTRLAPLLDRETVPA